MYDRFYSFFESEPHRIFVGSAAAGFCFAIALCLYLRRGGRFMYNGNPAMERYDDPILEEGRGNRP